MNRHSFASHVTKTQVHHRRTTILFHDGDKMFQKLRGYLQKLAGFESDARLRRANHRLQGDVENDDDFRILGQWELNFGHFGGGQGRFHFACACKPS